MGSITHNGEVLQSLPANASQINFDKTGTDLNATQAEAAIKEVNEKVNTNAEDINQLRSGLTGRLEVNVTLPATTNGRSSVLLPDATIPVGAKVVGYIITDVSTYGDAVSIGAYFIGRTCRVTMIGSVDEVPQITLKLIVGITY